MSETKEDFDYDFRQLNLMEQQLSQFEAAKVTLPHLISGLESLRDCLRTIDEEWKKKFTGEWWTLEQVHAVALDRKKTALSSEDSALVSEAVCNLKSLVASAKAKLKSVVDEPDV